MGETICLTAIIHHICQCARILKRLFVSGFVQLVHEDILKYIALLYHYIDICIVGIIWTCSNKHFTTRYRSCKIFKIL